MKVVLFKITEHLERLEALLSDLREDLDRADANNAGAQVNLKKLITETTEEIERSKRFQKLIEGVAK